MAQQTLTVDGAVARQDRDAMNHNFSELYAYAGVGPPIDFSAVVPAAVTDGALVTTHSNWLAFSTVGSCGMKLLLAYSATSGDFATLRMRARSDGAGDGVNGVSALNGSASAGVNNCANLIGLAGLAQPMAYTNNRADHIDCGLYSCIDASGASSGRDWSTWSDTHATRKPTGLSCLHRLSHNGTVNYDTVFSVYQGGRTPVLFNFEDASGSLSDTSLSLVTQSGAIAVQTPAGTKYLPLYDHP